MPVTIRQATFMTVAFASTLLTPNTSAQLKTRRSTRLTPFTGMTGTTEPRLVLAPSEWEEALPFGKSLEISRLNFSMFT